jgi:acyl-CoA synthetase (AMP-forming)/AMP-acid ligase II
MFERFLSLTAAQPDAAALIDSASDRVITRCELLARADELAAELTGAGVVARDLIAIQLPNSLDFVAAIIAASKLDLVAMPIDRDARAREVEAIVEQFGIRAVVGQAILPVRTDVRTGKIACPTTARLIKLTSGSTGFPKGVVTSEQNLIADSTSICASMDIRPGDVNFGAIPMSHSYGFSNLVMPLLLQGTPVVISNQYLPQSIVELCNRYTCTVVPLIPMVFEHLSQLTDGEFSTVRTFLSAGAPLPAATSRRFRERFRHPIHSFYGCSECGGIAYDRAGAAAERGAIGTAMEDVSLSIDNARLTVRSASVTLGYLHDATTFRPFDSSTFITDDLVEMIDGEVVLIGRTSDLINTAGKKVNPREVEQVILQMDGVREVKVYAAPAGARGDVVAAAIVADGEITRDQVRAFCAARLSAHKVPRIVKLIEELPLDERGKVKRAALAAL